MIENVWKWEMEFCCSMQLKALYKKLSTNPHIRYHSGEPDMAQRPGEEKQSRVR